MNPDATPPESPSRDELDAWLAARPLRPSANFAENTLARIAREKEAADPELDALLASCPVTPSRSFTDDVFVRIAALRRRRFLLLRVAAPAALAACLALATLPSFGLGNHRGESGESLVAAAIANDAELNSLASLPAGTTVSASAGDTRIKDLAAFAALDAALAANNSEYAYGI